MGAMTQLVKCLRLNHKDMGLIPTGNICFFSVNVTKLASMVLTVTIFFEKLSEHHQIDYRNKFYKNLLDYQNIESQAAKLGKLSDYLISDTKLKLLDFRISDSKKTIDYPALVKIQIHDF